MTFPVILGSGKRLFGDGAPPGAMRMVEHQITTGGNIIAPYQPDGAVETGTPAQKTLPRQVLAKAHRLLSAVPAFQTPGDRGLCQYNYPYVDELIALQSPRSA